MNSNALLAHLQSLESELHHPGVHCTRARLQQLLHPAFHEVGRSGRPYTRDFVIETLVAQTTPPPVIPEDFRLELVAEGCALLTYRSTHPGKDGVAVALRASLWLLNGGTWQLYYHQGTPVMA